MNISGIWFKTGHPAEAPSELWDQMYRVAHSAYTAEFVGNPEVGKRTPEEIDYFLSEGSIGRFRAGRIDPQVDVEAGRLLEGQLFRSPTLVVAFRGLNRAIAHGLIYDNTSDPLRKAKMAVPPGLRIPKLGHRRYGWVREIVVDPEEQKNGLGLVIGHLLLASRHDEQPISVYEYDPTNEKVAKLERLDLHKTGSRRVKPFGLIKRPAEMVRFEGRSALAVSRGIRARSYSAAEALKLAVENTQSFDLT